MPALKAGKTPKSQRRRQTEPAPGSPQGDSRLARDRSRYRQPGSETMPSRRASMRSPMSALLGVLVAGFIAATPALAQSRGELLYSTHCISCHNQQMHWRDQRAATDWSSLQVQVRRWQSAASLGWAEADILEVARFLNATIYRFEPAAEPRTSLGPEREPSLGARPPNPVGCQSNIGKRSAAS